MTECNFRFSFDVKPMVRAMPSPPAPIALFTDTYHEINGVSNTFRRIVAEFTRRGIPLHVYTYGSSPMPNPSDLVQVREFSHGMSLPYYEHLRWELWPNRKVAKSFWEQHRKTPYRGVHIASPSSMGWMGRLLARRAGVPLIGSYHTHIAHYIVYRSPVARRLLVHYTWKYLGWFYRPCRLLLVPTHQVARDLESHGIHIPTDIFTRGIDSEAFSPAHRTETSDPTTVLYVGRLSKEKSVEQLPELLDGVKANVMIVGDGPERDWLETALPEATFTGYCRGQELARRYANADVLLFPSRSDTFGNVVLEAMSSGVVPIVADATGPRDFVTDGVNAFVGKDVAEMKHALQSLLCDEDRRRAMSAQARAYAETCDWEVAVNQLISAYDRVCAD